MKIYRYVPDGWKFRAMAVGYEDRFWPDGISLGKFAEQEFPKALFGARWQIEGNRYTSRPGANLPIADFVATSMNVLVVGERAATLFPSDMKRPVHADGEAAWAIQLPALSDILATSQSSGVLAPEGEPLFWNTYQFNPALLTAEVFWLQDEMPFSYVYMTETFVQKAHDLGLTGLDYVELVWDGSPRELTYPAVKTVREQAGYRFYLEIPFLLARASMFGYVSSDINPILDQAMSVGKLPVKFPSSTNQ